eukprot:1158109-Pelagomonas_calceolata.AAC.16
MNIDAAMKAGRTHAGKMDREILCMSVCLYVCLHVYLSICLFVPVRMQLRAAQMSRKAAVGSKGYQGATFWVPKLPEPKRGHIVFVRSSDEREGYQGACRIH